MFLTTVVWNCQIPECQVQSVKYAFPIYRFFLSFPPESGLRQKNGANIVIFLLSQTKTLKFVQKKEKRVKKVGRMVIRRVTSLRLVERREEGREIKVEGRREINSRF